MSKLNYDIKKDTFNKRILRGDKANGVYVSYMKEWLECQQNICIGMFINTQSNEVARLQEIKMKLDVIQTIKSGLEFEIAAGKAAKRDLSELEEKE